MCAVSHVRGSCRNFFFTASHNPWIYPGYEDYARVPEIPLTVEPEPNALRNSTLPSPSRENFVEFLSPSSEISRSGRSVIRARRHVSAKIFSFSRNQVSLVPFLSHSFITGQGPLTSVTS